MGQMMIGVRGAHSGRAVGLTLLGAELTAGWSVISATGTPPNRDTAPTHLPAWGHRGQVRSHEALQRLAVLSIG